MLGPISSVLKSPALEPRNISLLELATQQGRQLLNLVNEILDLTKLEAGKLELDESPIALFPLVNRIAGYFENHASRQGIGFLFDFRADRALHLELDAPRFETILNNLLSNAVKFTPAVAEAQVRVQVDDLVHSIRLTVSDTGKGIHPADLPQVFDRFYQSRQPGASSHGGTGIGLALCRELVELMHGKIRVESELGKGTSFFVEIPKKEVFGMDVDLEPDAQLQ
jgi:signal transduction histidine kinase